MVMKLPHLAPLTFDCMDGKYCIAKTDAGREWNIAGFAECELVTVEQKPQPKTQQKSQRKASKKLSIETA